MGKFPNSTIHERYSAWHWELINKDEKYKRLYVSDIDRLWFEYDFNNRAVIAAIDLKWLGSGDETTATEKGICEWLESHGARYYTVYINHEWGTFKVVNSRGEHKWMSPLNYADWLLSLRDKKEK